MLTNRGLLLLACFLLLVPVISAQKQRGFVVEEKVQEALEKNAGVRERYALLVGVSKYANPTINLNFAAADAKIGRASCRERV